MCKREKTVLKGFLDRVLTVLDMFTTVPDMSAGSQGRSSMMLMPSF